ncbi:MAG: hypothetical protein ACRC2T_04835 [Thermoguttaceae bacterium]
MKLQDDSVACDNTSEELQIEQETFDHLKKKVEEDAKRNLRSPTRRKFMETMLVSALPIVAVTQLMNTEFSVASTECGPCYVWVCEECYLWVCEECYLNVCEPCFACRYPRYGY